MADRLESQVAAGGVDVNALRHFASQADEVTPDSQGRVRLLPHLRELGGLDRNVIVTGAPGASRSGHRSAGTSSVPLVPSR